jgi:hypothetical protein
MKHLNYLGEKYLLNKLKERYKRQSKENLENGWGFQYTNDEENIKRQYKDAYEKMKAEITI